MQCEPAVTKTSEDEIAVCVSVCYMKKVTKKNTDNHHNEILNPKILGFKKTNLKLYVLKTRTL